MSGETRAGVYGSRMATRGKSAEDSGGSGDGGRPMAGWQAEACPTKAEPHAEACPAQFAPSVRDFQKRSEEHTSELQALRQLVCRLLLEKIIEGERPVIESARTAEHVGHQHLFAGA